MGCEAGRRLLKGHAEVGKGLLAAAEGVIDLQLARVEPSSYGQYRAHIGECCGVCDVFSPSARSCQERLCDRGTDQSAHGCARRVDAEVSDSVAV